MSVPLHVRLNAAACRIAFLAAQNEAKLPDADFAEIIDKAMEVFEATRLIAALEEHRWAEAWRARRALRRGASLFGRLWRVWQRAVLAP